MRRLSIFILLLLSPAATLSQPVRHGDPVVEVIGADEVNVRDDRDPEGEVIAKVQRGDRLKRLASEEGWFKVGLPDGRQGWINGRYGRADVAREVLVVTASAIKLRRNPSAGAPEVTQAMQGDQLKFLSERNNWYFVQAADGQKAWVHKDFVSFRSRTQDTPAEKPAEPPPDVPASEEPPGKTDRFQEGLDLLKIGNEDRALETFQALLKETPNHGGAHFEMGRILKARKPQEALDHFQKALTGEPKHPEAQFYIEELRKSKPMGAPAEAAEPRRGGWIGAVLSDDLLVQMVLYGGGFAALLFIGVLLWTYRRRRRALAGGGLAAPRGKDGGFEATLKAASERRPLLKVIEEAERRQEEAEEGIRKQFEAFGGVTLEAGESLKLPEMEPVQALLKKVEEIRQVVVEQEERARMYTDLIQLQNGKIEALNAEIEALKKLVLLKEEEARREKPRPKQKV